MLKRRTHQRRRSAPIARHNFTHENNRFTRLSFSGTL
jgi:hypothetical protein